MNVTEVQETEELEWVPMRRLVGKTILWIDVDAPHTNISFMTSVGRLGFAVEGGCCSVSWIEHLSGVDQLLEATVTRVESVDMPEAPDDGGETVTQVYGVRITTDRGVALLEFRNESNGYYGGAIRYDESVVTGVPISSDF